MAEEQWYKPVNTGDYYVNFVLEDRVPEQELEQYFTLLEDDLITQSFINELAALFEDWQKHEDGRISPEFQNDPHFVLHADHKIEHKVDGFSRDSVNVAFYFEYGSSRWHHYLVLLKNIIFPRTKQLDRIFHLDDLDELYAGQYKDVKYGTSEAEMEAVLGNEYFEYLGQSPQLRNIYYKNYDVEICIQNGMVKFIREGRPGWMDSNHIRKPVSND